MTNENLCAGFPSNADPLLRSSSINEADESTSLLHGTCYKKPIHVIASNVEICK